MENISSNLPLVHVEGKLLVDGSTKWKEAKMKSLAVSNALSDSGRSQRMFDCGTELQFAISNSGEHRLCRANFCRDRMCPACQRRRSLVVFHQVKNVCQAIQKDFPTYKYLLLTLTVPNVKAGALSNEIKHLSASWDRLSRRAIFKKSIKGFFRATEVTYNGDRDDYHPHLHVLLCVPSGYFKNNYINRDTWLELWRDATRYPEITQVDVRAIKPNPKRTDSDCISSAAAEVGKYATKPSNYLARFPDGSYYAFKNVVNELASAIARKRLVSFGGIMKEYQAKLLLEDPESDNADLINVDGNQESIDAVMKYVYRWNVGLKNYYGI